MIPWQAVTNKYYYKETVVRFIWQKLHETYLNTPQYITEILL